MPSNHCRGGGTAPPSGREAPANSARPVGGAAAASPPRAPPRRVALPFGGSFGCVLLSRLSSILLYLSGGAMAASDADGHLQNVGCRTLSLSAHVGFDSLPDQLIRKSIKHGFCFNILCIGETGIGKSALVSSLFNTDFADSPSTHFLSSVRLRAQTFELQESNVLLKLTVVKTVGFGDQVNKADSYQPIVDYVDAQFEAYLEEELKVIRSLFNYHDTRIHVCLYFISPTGRSLKTIDLLTMRSLDSKVNIIPVIGKADSISKSELQEFKKKIMSELVSNGIRIYQFPTDDETVSEINAITNGYLPFAVVGSMEKVKIGNKMVRARQYPWGIVKVENENHCDTIKLRRMLCTNMEDLKEKTRAYYESYRRCRLEKLGCRDIGPENKPVSLQEVVEAKRLEFCLEVERKEEEIKQRFVQRVKEKAAMLEEAEQQVLTKFEHLMLMHQEEELKLGEKKKLLEDEIAQFIEKKTVTESIQSQVSVFTPGVSLKTQGLRKNQDFQLEVQCFHTRDEGTMNVGEQSERASEKEELEREIHPGNFRNSI